MRYRSLKKGNKISFWMHFHFSIYTHTHIAKSSIYILSFASASHFWQIKSGSFCCEQKREVKETLQHFFYYHKHFLLLTESINKCTGFILHPSPRMGHIMATFTVWQPQIRAYKQRSKGKPGKSVQSWKDVLLVLATGRFLRPCVYAVPRCV